MEKSYEGQRKQKQSVGWNDNVDEMVLKTQNEMMIIWNDDKAQFMKWLILIPLPKESQYTL